MENKKDVDKRDEMLRPFLMGHAKKGSLDRLKFVVKQGADIEGQDKWGKTARMHSLNYLCAIGILTRQKRIIWKEKKLVLA